jgi:hypothetical protein
MTVFYIALPIALAAFGNVRKWSLTRLILLGVMSIAVTSGFILYASESKWRKLEKALYAYDTDGDGSFSKEELVPEAERLKDAYTADTGRGMGPVIKGFWATVYTLASFLIVNLYFKVRVFREEEPDELVQ